MLLVFLFMALWNTPPAHWLHDYSEAQNRAQTENKPILLVFSGSDWCRPCIQLRKSIWENSDFTTFAHERLILLEADFPRSRKNKLPKTQRLKNDALAQKYNPKGQFPRVLLLDSTGQVRWTFHYKQQSPKAFIHALETQLND